MIKFLRYCWAYGTAYYAERRALLIAAESRESYLASNATERQIRELARIAASTHAQG